MEKEEIYQKILVKVIAFLAYRIRTRKEIITRLKKYLDSQKNAPEDVKEDITRKILEYLEENKLINDKEFTRLFVESKTRGKRALGRKSIENKLIAKGIDRSEAEQYLDTAVKEEDELRAAVKLVEGKFGLAIENAKILNSGQEDRYGVKIKMSKYLLSRGFSYSISKRAVDYLLKRP